MASARFRSCSCTLHQPRSAQAGGRRQDGRAQGGRCRKGRALGLSKASDSRSSDRSTPCASSTAALPLALLLRCAHAGGRVWPHLQDALLDGVGDHEARDGHVAGLAQPVHAVVRCSQHKAGRLSRHAQQAKGGAGCGGAGCMGAGGVALDEKQRAYLAPRLPDSTCKKDGAQWDLRLNLEAYILCCTARAKPRGLASPVPVRLQDFLRSIIEAFQPWLEPQRACAHQGSMRYTCDAATRLRPTLQPHTAARTHLDTSPRTSEPHSCSSTACPAEQVQPAAQRLSGTGACAHPAALRLSRKTAGLPGPVCLNASIAASRCRADMLHAHGAPLLATARRARQELHTRAELDGLRASRMSKHMLLLLLSGRPAGPSVGRQCGPTCRRGGQRRSRRG